MIKFLIRAISSGIGFSKTEAKGALVLIFVIIIVQFSFTYFSLNAKNNEKVTEDSSNELKLWVEEIESAYSEKPSSKANAFEKADYQPITKGQKEKNTQKNKITFEKADHKIAEKIIIKDINSASAEDLRSVKGIGKVYSERIIKYRDRLGGFSHTHQLGEVYGLSEELIEKITSRFSVQSEVEPIDINSDSVKNLLKHPYITYDLAWVLINYRKQNGDINGIEDLSKIKAVDDSLINKLRPYLN